VEAAIEFNGKRTAPVLLLKARKKKVNLRKMAGGNLDFLKGMALESAQLAVNYVKGEGGDATNSSHTSNVTAVSDSNCVPIL
jgi:hypothetical protein